MTEMLIKLTSFERDQLRKLARKNGCHPRDQARLIIRSALLGESPPAVVATNEKSGGGGRSILDLYQWYTIRHSLHLLLNKLIQEETDDSTELESQRVDECVYAEQLQAKVAQIIDAEEKRLGVTPIKASCP